MKLVPLFELGDAFYFCLEKDISNSPVDDVLVLQARPSWEYFPPHSLQKYLKFNPGINEIPAEKRKEAMKRAHKIWSEYELITFQTLLEYPTREQLQGLCVKNAGHDNRNASASEIFSELAEQKVLVKTLYQRSSTTKKFIDYLKNGEFKKLSTPYKSLHDAFLDYHWRGEKFPDTLKRFMNFKNELNQE